nr:cytochrome c biogenesis CcdA family protein [Streptomyces alkaliphilus]
MTVAFLGGLLALLSPCSALLLPGFFAYSFTTRTRLLARTCVFYLGLCLTLVPLGVAGAFAGRLFHEHRETLVAVGGWTMIAFGLVQIAGLGFGSRRMAAEAGRRRSGSAASVLALGAVYGLAGFCAGPILGAVLTVAAIGGDQLYGGVLLATYALGMAAPVFLLALLWDRYDLGRRRWLRGRAVRLGPLSSHSTSVIGGLVFVLLGIVFLAFDGTSTLPALLDTETEFAWQLRLAAAGEALPDRMVLLLAAGVAAIVAVVAWRGGGTSEATAVEPRSAEDGEVTAGREGP